MKAIFITLNNFKDYSLSDYDYYSTIKSLRSFIEKHPNSDWQPIFLTNVTVPDKFLSIFNSEGILVEDSTKYIEEAIEYYKLTDVNINNVLANWYSGLISLPFIFMDFAKRFSQILVTENDVFFNKKLVNTTGNHFFVSAKSLYKDSWLFTRSNVVNFYPSFYDVEIFNSSHILFTTDNSKDTIKLFKKFIELNYSLIELGYISFDQSIDFYEYFGTLMSLSSKITNISIEGNNEIHSWARMFEKEFQNSNWHRNYTFFTKEFQPERPVDLNNLKLYFLDELQELKNIKFKFFSRRNNLQKFYENWLIKIYLNRFLVVDKLLSLKFDSKTMSEIDKKIIDFTFADQNKVLDFLLNEGINVNLINSLKRKNKTWMTSRII